MLTLVAFAESWHPEFFADLSEWRVVELVFYKIGIARCLRKHPGMVHGDITILVFTVIAAAIVATAIYLIRKYDEGRKGPPPTPVQPKARQRNMPPPAGPKPAQGKSAEQVFREAFPGVRFAPIAFKPFCVRAEACQLREKVTGEQQPGIRIDVSGGVEVANDVTVDLIVTMEDVTDGASQPVYATQDRYQDEQTGQFVLRTTIGKVTQPGRPDSGWTSVGVIPFSNIRAPKSGGRILRLSCLAVPSDISGLTVVDERLRSGMLAAATVNFEVALVRKGYVEQRFARQNAAGLVVCLSFAFATHAFRDAHRAESFARVWMDRHLAQMKGEDEGLVAQTRVSIEAAFAMARVTKTDLRVACRELLAYEVADMAQEGLGLCVEIGRSDDVIPADIMIELKALCRELGLGLDALQRHASASAPGAAADDDQECATLIGLDLRWDSRRIRRHLLDQFMKWNSRHPKDATERATITRRLEAIAKLRQRYL